MAQNDGKDPYDGDVLDANRLVSTGKALENSDFTLDNIFRAHGFGKAHSSIVNSLYGFDILGQASPAPLTNEHPGLTFFTRPLLNLSYDNIRNRRDFIKLADPDRDSNAAFVQAILDPLGNHECPYVDPLNGFIPLLSNTITSIGGWQEPILDTYVSPNDRLRGQYSYGDSETQVNQIYPLSVSFRNMRSNPLGLLFHVWVTYIGLVASGKFSPYPEFMAKHIVDYQTRIYKLIMDPSRRYVEEIVAPHVTYPLADRAAQRADGNSTEHVNKDVDLYSQTFQATGADYYDPAMLDDFNKASTMFNPIMRNPVTRQQQMRRLWPGEFKALSYRAYPFINERTSELEWWIPNTVHERLMGKVNYPSY